MLIIQAKYPSTCRDCSCRIKRSDVIGWDRYCKIVVCKDCVKNYANGAKQDVDPAGAYADDVCNYNYFGTTNA